MMLGLPRSAIDEEEDKGENHHRRSANEHSVHAFHLTPPASDRGTKKKALTI